MNILDVILGDKGATILAGAMGGVVRWITLHEGVKAGVASVIVGGICAVYLTPLVLPVLTPMIGTLVGDEANRAGFSGFIIGLAGITVSGFLIDFFKLWTNRKLANDKEG